MPINEKQKIALVTSRILNTLDSSAKCSTGKAFLAKLRNSVGKPLSETIDVWPIIFEHLPEEFLGRGEKESYEEMSILTSLQLYAIHQQGGVKSVLLSGDDGFRNMGFSLKQLRKGDNQLAVDRRFNAMITSTTFEEFAYHLRHLITLLKAKSSDTQVSYAKLSEDLYWFLKGYKENVRLAWAREYYKQNNKGEERL